MSRIEDIRARLDRYWSDDTAVFVAHAPSDMEDLLAVVEAAQRFLNDYEKHHTDAQSGGLVGQFASEHAAFMALTLNYRGIRAALARLDAS